MMEVKGSAVIPVSHYMKEKHPEKYDQWLQALTPESQEIIKSGLTSIWYPLEPGIIEPTRKACDLFQDNPSSLARDMGRYSADKSLKGIYSIFIKAGSPGFIMNRATKIFSSYYRPCELIVSAHNANSITTQITTFPEPDDLIENRIAGWMERALELSGCQDVNASITRSLTKGDSLTEILLTWK